MYHANLTEQVFNTTNAAGKAPLVAANAEQQQLPVEIKTNRIKILRILAIKAAAILNWNLVVLEKE